ncbi:MAG: carbohydrate kinase [Verrucomicrobiae bacterium]|nr:carbohydrate kinase [Verrucomicrobiae bacterium]
MDTISDSPAFDIVGIGMSTIDLLKVVEEFPEGEGVTEVIENRLQGGGPVASALVTAAKLGASAAIVDRIGSDWRGELVRHEYRAAGVDTRFLELEPDRETTFAAVLVRQRDGARHVIFSPGNFTPLAIDEMPVQAIKRAKVLHLNGRHWPGCVDAALAIRGAGGLVSFDGGAGRFHERLRELLPLVDIHISARDFVANLAESDDTGEQLAAMIGLGAKIAAVTDGENGSWFATEEGEVFHQPAFAVEPIVDTTGCGDVFHGAFLFAHLRGWSVKEAATFASAAAALNATELGGRGHLATLEEIRELIVQG